MSPEITLYSRPGCEHCRQAKEYLRGRGVAFRECDVSRDAAAMDELKRINAPGLPVIVVDRQAVLGFDRERLDDLLKATLPPGGSEW